MPIAKGETWGWPGRLPDDGVVVRDDAEAATVLETARRQGRAMPTLGLLGGDLCRTLGGIGSEARLRSSDAMTFPVDLGEVAIDGKGHLFVAHLVARNRLWTRVFAAMNAQFVGPWDVAPRSHPNDSLLDTFEARLRLADVHKVRARLPLGTYLPHPSIRQRRTAALTTDLERPRPIWLDGVRQGKGRVLELRIEPDAIRVVV